MHWTAQLPAKCEVRVAVCGFLGNAENRMQAVFIISWRTPGPQDRDVALDDYRTLGIMSALDVIGRILPNRKVHAAGYCLGGALLTRGHGRSIMVAGSRPRRSPVEVAPTHWGEWAKNT
jgi:hypothetical protein